MCMYNHYHSIEGLICRERDSIPLDLRSLQESCFRLWGRWNEQLTVSQPVRDACEVR